MNKNISSRLTGVYPGTFDPITYGHKDIIIKAFSVVDELVIAVAKDVVKDPLFSLEERLEMINHTIDNIKIPANKSLKAVSFSGLLIDFVKKQNSHLIIRGLRAVSDFEYEFQMSAMNAKLDDSIQTIFLPATEKTQFIASRIVKEIARLRGDVSGFVSPIVEKKLKAYYNS